MLNDLLGSTELAAQISTLNNHITENFAGDGVRLHT